MAERSVALRHFLYERDLLLAQIRQGWRVAHFARTAANPDPRGGDTTLARRTRRSCTGLRRGKDAPHVMVGQRLRDACQSPKTFHVDLHHIGRLVREECYLLHIAVFVEQDQRLGKLFHPDLVVGLLPSGLETFVCIVVTLS